MNYRINLFEIIKDRFESLYPFSIISNVILYRNDREEIDLLANEIDHLFHYIKNDKDHLVIIESKQNQVYGNKTNEAPTSNSKWQINYNEHEKDIKKQVRDQAVALKQFCHNVANEKPEIECWVVDLRDDDQHIIVDEKNKNICLLTLKGFGHKLDQVRSVIRVEHSDFLRELRRGIIAQDLGHPEINNAIRFIKTCRKSLDDQIYRFFQPRQNYYAINGCAGMGKSVLLAYSLFVFASDYAVYFNNDNKPILEHFKEKNLLPAFNDRIIYVSAVKEKQIRALEFYWNEITEQISRITNQIPALKTPIFQKWKGEIPEDCTILVLDEAHDLSIKDQSNIANWITTNSRLSSKKYLVVACDRNQALKRNENDQDIIAGLNFSLRTTRLNRIYRCPFPAHVASIGILFRWFAQQGGSIVLSNQRLREYFGFKPYVKEIDDGMLLTMRNDCHPGNNWCQTVSHFNNCSTAFSHIEQFKLNSEDVLWACFKKTEDEFDYLKIQRNYTYVDLRNSEIENQIDLHIKGQEFSIVIVEGLPVDMNPSQLIKDGDWGENPSEVENKMWLCRKYLYVVCSRATAFLYFISDFEKVSDPNTSELKNLMDQVSKSFRKKNESGQTWEIKVNNPKTKRKPELFSGIEDAIIEQNLMGDFKKSERVVKFDGILNVPELSKAFGILQQEFQDLLPGDAKARNNIEITVRREDAEIVAKKLDIKFEYSRGVNIKKNVQQKAITHNLEESTKIEKIVEKNVEKNKNIKNIQNVHDQTDRKIVYNRQTLIRGSTLPFTGDCTKRKINKICFFEKVYHPDKWQELLTIVADELYKRHKDSFHKCLALQGTKRNYFSTNYKELRQPKPIGVSKYFVETNLNANEIVRRCRELMALFGYGERNLDLFVN